MQQTSSLSVQGDLVYVNYGSTEDFFQLQRTMGINVTGKIVIVRYGKLFRGNKVENLQVVIHRCCVVMTHQCDTSSDLPSASLCCSLSTRWRTPCWLEQRELSCTLIQQITVLKESRYSAWAVHDWKKCVWSLWTFLMMQCLDKVFKMCFACSPTLTAGTCLAEELREETFWTWTEQETH